MDLASRPAVSLCQANITKINATVVAKSVKCFFADGDLSSTSPESLQTRKRKRKYDR